MQVKRKFKRNLNVKFREYKVAIRDLKGKKLESRKKGLIENSKKIKKRILEEEHITHIQI